MKDTNFDEHLEKVREIFKPLYNGQLVTLKTVFTTTGVKFGVIAPNFFIKEYFKHMLNKSQLNCLEQGDHYICLIEKCNLSLIEFKNIIKIRDAVEEDSKLDPSWSNS